MLYLLILPFAFALLRLFTRKYAFSALTTVSAGVIALTNLSSPAAVRPRSPCRHALSFNAPSRGRQHQLPSPRFHSLRERTTSPVPTACYLPSVSYVHLGCWPGSSFSQSIRLISRQPSLSYWSLK